MLSVFVAEFFRETLAPFLAIFQSSICLSFFCRGFLVTSSVSGVGGVVMKIYPRFPAQNPAVEGSLHLSF